MKTPSFGDMIEIGVQLETLGSQIARGEIPDPRDIVKLLAAATVAFTDDIEELKPYLDAASRARQDYLVDLAARAQLGERPK